MLRVALLPLLLLFSIILAGCTPPTPVATSPAGPPAPPPPPGAVSAAPPAATASPEAAPAGQPPLPVETKAGVFAGGLNDLAAPVAGQESAAPAPASTPPADPNTERVKAEAGVGKQGQSLKEHEGVVVTPVKSLFAFKQKAVFDIQIPQALQLFQATEGRMPASHDEFMQKIVADNQIKLPELPSGHKYLYDPERGELMVERPKIQGE